MSTIVKQQYNPSVNIIRDLGKSLSYITTPNSELVFKEIVRQYYRGSHAFTLVGAYGTGKSSFLLALEREFNKQGNYFSTVNISFSSSFEVLPIVGNFESIIEVFAEKLNIKDDSKISVSNIIKKIEARYRKLSKEGKGLAIYIDEFGKLLEFAANNNPEAELYFIQQLSELVNDSEKEILLITTLHQGFNSYSRGLTKSQQQEWDKVRGRLSEVNFNEPVEQLLYLAGKKLEKNQINITTGFNELFSLIKDSKTFPLKDYLDIESAKKLLPFDLLSASILTLALQRYGQNQRSLFSFIDSNSYLSIENFDREKFKYYNLACVYDYLSFNYHSHLSTKYNPDFAQWAAIRSSIERVEGFFSKEIENASNIVKVIGLLQIFTNKGGKIDKPFLANYVKYSMGIDNSDQIISLLEQHKIILYSNYNQKYRLFEGTDINIEVAIDEAGNLVQRIGNVVDYLKRSFDFPYILAKEVFYHCGTPRFFGFHLSDQPDSCEVTDQIDGYINLIFNDNYSVQEVNNFSKNLNEPILFGLFRNTKEIKGLLFEIEKIKKAIDINKADLFAVKEFKGILDHQRNILNHYIFDNLYTNNKHIQWIYNGEQIYVPNQKSLNRTLSKISNEIYFGTPILRNELINKTKTSSVISTARKNLIARLTDNIRLENLGFNENEFPPEKTIYLTLLQKTGLHREIEKKLCLTKPTDSSYLHLWNIGTTFIDKAKYGKRKISEFVNLLKEKPFKLKNGVIDFWLPIFLISNKNHFALYEQGRFIPELSNETIELIIRKPIDYEIKAFDIKGNKLKLLNKYRILLNQLEEREPTSLTFIETFKPFIVFYNSLSFYSANTKRLSDKSIAFRSAIEYATDPESIFFEEFPKAIGYTQNQLLDNTANLEDFVISLKSCIQEVNESYDNLINRIENFILERILGDQMSFPTYKERIIERYRSIKKHQLNVKQKAILQRINSPLEDRKSWLNSLSYSLINKSLENITDEDEPKIYDLLEQKFKELDNLCDISKLGNENSNEEVYKLEITSFVRGLEERLIRLPKKMPKEIQVLQNSIKEKLKGNSKELNITLLMKLLQEELEDES